MIKLIETCDAHGGAAFLMGLFILSIIGTIAHVIIKLSGKSTDCDVDEDDYDE